MQTFLPGLISRATARPLAPAGLPLIVDNFAGAGGASLGIEAALGRPVDRAINHSRLMLDMHEVNHPHTRHLCEDVWHVDIERETAGREVGLAWFSPDCKDHSKAKGGVPLDKNIRGLAWVALRWIIEARPRVIILENVEEFRDWGPLTQATDARGRKLWYTGKDGKRHAKMIRDGRRKGEYFRAFVGAMSDGMLPSLDLVEELQAFWHHMAPLYRLMKGCGYKVECKVLTAADYGVPTTRKRFFLVARSDGQPIVWPTPTHAPRKKAAALGLLPWRSAAECIDWSKPCPSIFERKKPLAEATLRRIARGVVRHVIESAEPFIVTCNHGGDGGNVRPAGEPMRTITGSRDANGIVVPLVESTPVQQLQDAVTHAYLSGHCTDEQYELALACTMKFYEVDYGPDALAGSLVNISHYNGRTPANDIQQPSPTMTAHPRGGHLALVKDESKHGSCPHADQPVSTLDASNRFGLVSATLVTNTSGHAPAAPQEPVPTLTSGGQQMLSAATIQRFNFGEAEHVDPRKPMQTIVAQGNHHAIVAASMVQTGYGERDGQQPRALDIDNPLGTVVAGGQKHAVVAAHLVGTGGPTYSGKPAGVDEPLGTVMPDNHRAIAAAHLSKLYGTSRSGADVGGAMPTITGSGQHIAEVRAFLVKYYSSGSRDQSCSTPMHTLTAKARLGLVTAYGVDYQIVDIGLRMLSPAELLRAQFGRHADNYVLMGTQEQQVAGIGNSVPPELAEAIVRAQFPEGLK